MQSFLENYYILAWPPLDERVRSSFGRKLQKLELLFTKLLWNLCTKINTSYSKMD